MAPESSEPALRSSLSSAVAHNCGDMVTQDDCESLEEAKKTVRDLRQKTRSQAQQIMAWRRAYKMQVGNKLYEVSGPSFGHRSLIHLNSFQWLERILLPFNF